jgi:uncharacterized membrane protein
MAQSTRRTISVPVRIGLAAAAVAAVLTLVGLWRGGLFTWRNVLTGLILGGGTWGVITWAIVQTVFMVEEDTQEGEQH